jgi:Regulator of ribonuclease activity B
MKRLLLAFATLLFIATAGSPALAKESSVIPLDKLKEMFADMRTNPGYKKWNVDGPQLWGYFFTDPDSKKLQPVAEYLSSNGYRFVAIYPTDDKSTFFLHVEKVEHHTPESLNQRN